MCYDDKIKQLADKIAPHVLFDTVEEAEEFWKSYKLPESESVPKAIRRMAEHFITYASRFGVEEFVSDPRRHYRTHISKVSEAIRLCARRYVEQHELRQLAEIGFIDRSQMVVSA